MRMVKDMRSYLKALEEADEILHIENEVDPKANLGALAWQANNRLGKATWFKKLQGYPNWTAVSYIHGSRKRIAVGMETPVENYIKDLAKRFEQGLTKCRLVNDGPVREVVWTGNKVDLGKIPIHIHSNCDAGPYIGNNCIVKDPETGIRNLAIIRFQIKSKNKTGIAMHPGRHTDMIYQKYERNDEPMPIAVVIGHHPAYHLAGTWTTAFGIDELEIAGTLMGEPVDLVRCETIDLEVPAHAELVIEGEVPPHIREPEGPFGEHHGLMHGGKKGGPRHIVNVKAVTMRSDAIYYALQGGLPIAESQILDAVPQEIVLYNRLKDVSGYVDLRDIVIPPYVGGSHIVIIKMVPEVEGHARNVLMAALSSPYHHMKIAIAVDDDIDPNDPKDIWWSISTRVNPKKDIFIIPDVLVHNNDVSMDPLPPYESKFEPKYRIGSKMGIDATKAPRLRPEEREIFERIAPQGTGKVEIEDYV